MGNRRLVPTCGSNFINRNETNPHCDECFFGNTCFRENPSNKDNGIPTIIQSAGGGIAHDFFEGFGWTKK